jgi:DNA-binding PadR family transcriptional regulator
MHGYEVIKSLETRADGRYAPSPGVVYPTLQMLEDLGLVRSSEVNGKRVFELTDEGLQELNAHAEEVAAFWRQFAPATSPGRAEVRFVADELGYLGDTVWSVLNGVDSVDTIREVRQALEACRNQIRALVTGNVTEPQE